jgi:ketosteroid isomerase-like protein
MSHETVEIVRAVYERWREGDFRVSVDLFDPHAVLVIGPGFLDEGTYLGIAAIAAYMRELLEPWTHLTVEAEEIVPAGDSVLVLVRMRGLGSTSGIAMEERYFISGPSVAAT